MLLPKRAWCSHKAWQRKILGRLVSALGGCNIVPFTPTYPP